MRAPPSLMAELRQMIGEFAAAVEILIMCTVTRGR